MAEGWYGGDDAELLEGEGEFVSEDGEYGCVNAFSHVGECVGEGHGDEPVAQEGGCLLFLFLLRDVNSPRVFASLRVC